MIAYAITDPSTLNFEHLERDVKRFSSKATMLVYRDKISTTYRMYAEQFIAKAKGFDKVLLHGDYLLANALGAEGVHLKSTQFSDIAKAKALGLFVVISTHCLEEAIQAESLGADMLTFSPIFTTPNKGKALGVEVLSEVVENVTIPVIALGGILSDVEIMACKNAGAKGFASIRYFA